MFDWMNDHRTLFVWLSVASVVMFLGTLAAVPVLVARIPKDYFVRQPSSGWFVGRHPAVRLAAHLLKNLVGAALLLAGIAMLLLPGQGILTILLGLILIDFPGKRAMELALIRRPKVLGAVNWMRARCGRPPLEVE
jgi:hypothetical protein